MGIESDQLVFDYLSRVGDVAQQRQLPSGTRMRLVSGLRGEIDRRRAGAADSPAAIRRILDGLGTPDELVEAAADHPDDISAAIPEQRAEPQTGRLRRVVPRPRLRPSAGVRSRVVRPTVDTGGRPRDRYRLQRFGRGGFVSAAVRAQVPIIFGERQRGTSKMSSRIVVEAMLLVTWWAVRDRVLRRRR